ncbi:MAG: class I SAM-dependent methyltransferase [Acidobacteriota bacterium]
MITQKTEKELAFLHDLFVATDWGERFAQVIDEHVTLPAKGPALYLESGTGGHALALQERAGENLRFVCIEEHEEYLELAIAKAKAANVSVDFRPGRVDQLPLSDNELDLAIGDGSMVDPQRLPKMLAEMVRVVKPGKTVALILPTAPSFGEFFSIYWEALHNCGLVDQGANIETLITDLPAVTAVEELAERAGLEKVASFSRIEEFHYESGEQFLNSPLITDFLLPRWLAFVPEDSQECVSQAIPAVINADRHDADFILSVKATLVTGRKGRSN